LFAGFVLLYRFYDFFAGAGLVTLALRHAWDCLWANDCDPAKARTYRTNFGQDHFHLGDVAAYSPADLPPGAQLAWASFPCQDLSLAGWRKGISAESSGAFWPFWKIMREQHKKGCRPPLIAVENVAGLLHGGSFAGLCEALAALDMQFGALVIDARRFVPQSRPRVFFAAADRAIQCGGLAGQNPMAEWTPPALLAAHGLLERDLQTLWRWWQLPIPRLPATSLRGILETERGGLRWHSGQATRRLLSLMTAANQAKVAERQRDGGRHTGFLYRRTRNGSQRAEVRFDGLAGCLRTPRGGSSRQTVVFIEAGAVRTRLLSPREAARLMGAPDTFELPESDNQAYHAMGDAVVVPAVQWLSEHLLEPLAALTGQQGGLGRDLRFRRLERISENRATEWAASRRLQSQADLAN
jgi:DNA (cytosine-5)-methyltransferase 1